MVIEDFFRQTKEELFTSDDYEVVKKYNKKTKTSIEYINAILAFDIETSSFYVNKTKQACMYAWMISIDGRSYLGRTWDDFHELYDEIVEFYQTNENRRVIVWVHNLSYEFQWIRHHFDWIDVFGREKREPMKAVTKEGIEFRCSYVLSGCSLAVVANNLQKYDIKKMVGDLDYKLVRSYKTPLTEREKGYCLNDVRVLTAYIDEQRDLYGKLTQIPMTNTGRVRNFTREKCLSRSNYHKYSRLIKSLTLNKREYLALKRASTGGFTHANFLTSGRTINQPVWSKDFTSSYPAVMVAFSHYPMGKAVEIEGGVYTEEMILKDMETRCLVFNIKFINLRMKEDHWDCPLSISKTFDAEGEFERFEDFKKFYHYKDNNGRLMSGDKVYTTITDIDFTVFKEFYEWDEIEVGHVWSYKAGYLPKEIVEVIGELYRDKTTLKDVEEKAVEYLLKKGMLNSVFGMTIMSLITSIVYYTTDWGSDEGNLEEEIEKYNNNNQRFLFFPWGIFCCSLARRNLLLYGVCKLGEDYLYSDTDSLKYRNPEKYEKYFERYNEWITNLIKKACDFHGIPYEYFCPKTIKGKEKPIGVWDDDGKYIRFKTLGAKRYMYETQAKLMRTKHIKTLYAPNEIHTTIAGANKKGAAKYLSMQEDPFEAFSDQLEIPAEFAKRTVVKHIDEEYVGKFVDYLGEEFTYHELSGIHMEESSYHLGLSDVYKILLGERDKSYL